MVLNDAYILWNILLNHTSYNIHISNVYIYIHIPMRFPSYSHLMVFFHEIPIFDGSNPMESHGFFRVSPRPIRKWSSRKALRCRLPFRGQQKPWQICGKWELLWDEIWETMGKYGKTYIYILISMYNIDSDSMFFLFVFFEWSMDFPYLYHIYIICHMLMICCQSPTWMVIQVATDVDGFCLFFSDTPRCLAIACEICESQNGRLKPLKLVSNPPDIFWGYNA